MLLAVILGIALVAGPVVLVLGVLTLLGAAVAAMADAVPNGLVRPNPS
jgi:hypothetical protein